jgi:hypothetical protein
MVAQWSYQVNLNDKNWLSEMGGYVDFDPDQSI